ncbi:MAG TPA: lycopene cyclase domain-containing protein [Prolixibacteraceae bacterium]|nr:lycopene cyclase domain-containing protein [Prolixibacteraceae bacterium]
MEFKNFTYLIILAASVTVPLILSFDKKVQYYKNLKYILPAILVTAAVFLAWDINFTEALVWSFNSEYTIGIAFKGLPIEEWLFFFVIPYACVFNYEVLKFYFKKQEYANPFLAFSLLLVVGFALITYFFRNLGYTFLTFLFSTVYLGYTVFRNKFKQHITKFYFSYFVSLIPFMIVDGILTSLPVVKYNPAYILNIRILNIPVEDFSYFFLMLLMVTTIYEFLKESKYY